MAKSSKKSWASIAGQQKTFLEIKEINKNLPICQTNSQKKIENITIQSDVFNSDNNFNIEDIPIWYNLVMKIYYHSIIFQL